MRSADAIARTTDGADLLSMSVVTTNMENRSAKPESLHSQNAEGKEAIASGGDVEATDVPHIDEETMLKEVSTSAGEYLHMNNFARCSYLPLS